MTFIFLIIMFLFALGLIAFCYEFYVQICLPCNHPKNLKRKKMFRGK